MILSYLRNLLRPYIVQIGVILVVIVVGYMVALKLKINSLNGEIEDLEKDMAVLKLDVEKYKTANTKNEDAFKNCLREKKEADEACSSTVTDLDAVCKAHGEKVDELESIINSIKGEKETLEGILKSIDDYGEPIPDIPVGSSLYSTNLKSAKATEFTHEEKRSLSIYFSTTYPAPLVRLHADSIARTLPKSDSAP